MLWLWALDNAQDGNLSPFLNAEIARISGWKKKPDDFVDALIAAGFLTENKEIHDWYDYAGKLIDKRKLDAERKRIARGQARTFKGYPRDVQGMSAGNSEDGAGNRTVPNTVPSYSLDGGVDINNTKSRDLDSIAKDSLSKAADTAADDRATILKAYEESIGTITPTQADYLWSFLDSMEHALILKAIEEAADNNARSFKYVKTVLSSWLTAGLKTLADYTAKEAARAKRRVTNPPKVIYTFEDDSDKFFGSE